MGITMIWRTKKHPSISYGNYGPIVGYDEPRVINPFVTIEVYQRDMDAQRYEKFTRKGFVLRKRKLMS